MNEKEQRFTVEYVAGARESFNALDYRVTDNSIIFQLDASRERFLSKNRVKKVYQWREIRNAV